MNLRDLPSRLVECRVLVWVQLSQFLLFSAENPSKLSFRGPNYVNKKNEEGDTT
jgi:hypothetical protein